MNTSPPIPPWATSINITCYGIARKHFQCGDDSHKTEQIGVDFNIVVPCQGCTVNSELWVKSCYAKGSRQSEVIDFVPHFSSGQTKSTVSTVAYRGEGHCTGDVLFSISDGSYTEVRQIPFQLGWTVY